MVLGGLGKDECRLNDFGNKRKKPKQKVRTLTVTRVEFAIKVCSRQEDTRSEFMKGVIEKEKTLTQRW